MLVLSRKQSEAIAIGTDILIEVVEIRGDKVRLGITAPRAVPIYRTEILARIVAGAAGSGQHLEDCPNRSTDAQVSDAHIRPAILHDRQTTFRR
jgi:carbon storage regulator